MAHIVMTILKIAPPTKLKTPPNIYNPPAVIADTDEILNRLSIIINSPHSILLISFPYHQFDKNLHFHLSSISDLFFSQWFL